MTVEKAIVLIECSANELKEKLAETTMPSSAAEQIQRYIDAYDMAISALRKQETGSRQDSCPNKNIEPAWKRQFMRTFLGGR